MVEHGGTGLGERAPAGWPAALLVAGLLAAGPTQAAPAAALKPYLALDSLYGAGSYQVDPPGSSSYGGSFRGAGGYLGVGTRFLRYGEDLALDAELGFEPGGDLLAATSSDGAIGEMAVSSSYNLSLVGSHRSWRQVRLRPRVGVAFTTFTAADSAEEFDRTMTGLRVGSGVGFPGPGRTRLRVRLRGDFYRKSWELGSTTIQPRRFEVAFGAIFAFGQRDERRAQPPQRATAPPPSPPVPAKPARVPPAAPLAVAPYPPQGLPERLQPGAFTRALARVYRDYAGFERALGPGARDAAYYAGRAEWVEIGRAVAPHTVAEAAYEPARPWALVEARRRLQRAFADGAQTRHPELAAEAQGAFDCWARSTARGDALGHRRSCHATFASAMTNLDLALGGAEVPVETPPYFAAAGANPLAGRYTVFFDLTRARPNAASQPVLDRLAVYYAAAADQPAVRVVGYTDRAGTPAANRRLSEARATAVRAALVERGLPAGRFALRGRGENPPRVATPDDVAASANRRAVISFGAGPAS